MSSRVKNKRKLSFNNIFSVFGKIRFIKIIEGSQNNGEEKKRYLNLRAKICFNYCEYKCTET